MLCIGICQNEPDEGKAIQIPNDDANTVAIVAPNQPYDSEVEFDLCVYEPEFCRNASGIRATLALVPDSCKTQNFDGIKNIITYGLCRKNTITVSSLIADDLVISV